MTVLVTRHADVAACLRHPAVSSEIALGSLDRVPNPVFATYSAVLRRQMDLIDPPRHTQLRRTFGPAFGGPQLARLTAFADEWCRARLRSLPASFDVIADVARPLPLVTVMELLGVPSELQTAVARDIEIFVAGLGDPVGVHAAVAAALVSLRTSLSEVLARPDLPEHSVLAIARHLDLDDLIANVVLTVAAGHRTTTNLIGNGAWLLLEHRDQQSLVRTQPHYWMMAIEEMLRFESPVSTVRRVCAAAAEINGHALERGDELILNLGAANRDSDAFEHADRFDVTRTPNRHLAFGAGAHACLGAHLARLQAGVALTALFALPALSAVETKPAWAPSAVYRGLERLMVTRSH